MRDVLAVERSLVWIVALLCLAMVPAISSATDVASPTTTTWTVATVATYDAVANLASDAVDDASGDLRRAGPRAGAAGGSPAPSGVISAPNTARLTTRAQELHGALDPIAQTRRTTAIMSTRQGRDVLAGGVRDLSPAQRALAGSDDVLARLPGEHAEITALKAAGEAGLTPQGIATTTNICPACRAALEEAGATITGPRTAWWQW